MIERDIVATIRAGVAVLAISFATLFTAAAIAVLFAEPTATTPQPSQQFCFGNDHPRSEYPEGVWGPCKDIFKRIDNI